MGKFEQMAISIQRRAYNKNWAIAQFEQSCYLCCIKGRHANCKHCDIAAVHAQVVAILDDQEQKRKRRK